MQQDVGLQNTKEVDAEGEDGLGQILSLPLSALEAGTTNQQKHKLVDLITPNLTSRKARSTSSLSRASNQPDQH